MIVGYDTYEYYGNERHDFGVEGLIEGYKIVNDKGLAFQIAAAAATNYDTLDYQNVIYFGIVYTSDSMKSLADLGLSNTIVTVTSTRYSSTKTERQTIVAGQNKFDSARGVGWIQINNNSIPTIATRVPFALARNERPEQVLCPFVGGYNSPNFYTNLLSYKPTKTRPPFEDDITTTGGGRGDWEDDESDDIALPVLNDLNINGISNTKFFSCYKMSQDQLSALGNELWSSNMFTQLSNTVLKPTDFIVSLNLIPYDALGTTKLIKAGSILLNGVDGTLINSQFVRLDCGSVEVKEKWGGAIDYMTNVGLYLPFIGEVSLSPHEVMGATLNVSYTIDLLSGSCLASVKVTKGDLDSVLYQYNGNCASNFAITSGDYSQMWSAVFQGALTMASPTGGIMSAIADTNSNLLAGSGSPSSTRTGNLGSTVGFMSIKKPYLIITRPVQSLPEEYYKFGGYPSNITERLSNLKGYTVVDSIHLDGITATDAELKEIESLLKSGIIIA